jgi:type IV pilus assembly protein PilC
MPTYVFKAMDLAGIPARGEVDAISKQDVADQLKQRGLIVLDIASKYRSKELNFDLIKRVKPDQLAIATRQLATMVSSGMTILRAIHVLETQSDNKLLKETLAAVRGDVEAGLLLSDALERHPKVFNPLYVAMVRAGEAGGVLEMSLLRTADQLEKDASLRRQVRSAMIYPSLVISFALLVMLALVAFVIPVFEGVFKEFGGQLPTLTQFMVGFSHLIRDQAYILVAVVAAAAFAFIKWKKSKRGRAQWDAFKLRIPLKIGDVVQKVCIARWSRTLSSLTSAGVPVMQALDITGKTAGNAVLERAMGSVIDSVKAGGTMSEPLKQAKVFPAMVSHMVGVGEETGAVDAMLSKIADFYEDQVGAAVKALTSILEPAMIVIVGAMVGLIVISMYLPLFDVYNQIPTS